MQSCLRRRVLVYLLDVWRDAVHRSLVGRLSSQIIVLHRAQKFLCAWKRLVISLCHHRYSAVHRKQADGHGLAIRTLAAWYWISVNLPTRATTLYTKICWIRAHRSFRRWKSKWYGGQHVRATGRKLRILKESRVMSQVIALMKRRPARKIHASVLSRTIKCEHYFPQSLMGLKRRIQYFTSDAIYGILALFTKETL